MPLFRRLALVAALAFTAQGVFAADIEALRLGDMKKLAVTAPPTAMPEVVLLDEKGAKRRLDEWRGKVLVVNFWATWCASCRTEMPSLDRLQGAMGSDAFEVLTVATGRNSMPAIEKFFAEAGVTHLQILRDERQTMSRELGILGLPVTLILNREGQEVARMIGDAAWDGAEARALLAALVAEGTPGPTN
ncbi:TlpA disulfide reductase family protein [Phaeovulum sp.]|uniref:TlpA disulfide reductase family protein n=1 Tax=Phaeovulum sp. TaxID=2934796 RepID=UPI002732136D|nr:TlpA disulfide reductase family protein [Phaeovulum sp.]MDP1668778.1 TlpA disulfide reductase family protein [Phaeovulum sp.]MDZ4120594.1 TlpA disulfide reductase family protein [Phaeovulum sp.]